MNSSKINVCIFIYNEVEVLDFAGPFEVFSLAESIENQEKIFNVFTVSETGELISARNGLEVKPRYSFETCPPADILIIPGGYGAEQIEIRNSAVLSWIKKMSTEVQVIASVCTGAFLLAESGVITDHAVTTHWMDLDRLQSDYPDLKVMKNRKFMGQGKIFTAAGISSGIELSLHLIKRFTNFNVAEKTAKRMEYSWNDSGENI